MALVKEQGYEAVNKVRSAAALGAEKIPRERTK